MRFSEYGVELSDAMGFHLRLLWPDITRVGEVHTQLANPGAIGEDAGVRVAVGPMRSLGLIGWDEGVVPRNAAGWLRENLDAQPRSPVDGRPEVAIPLGGVDPNWPQVPMGQWVRQYRPDLLGGQQPAPGYSVAVQPGSGYSAAGQPAPGGQPGFQPGPGYPAVGQPARGAGQPGYPGAGQVAPAPGQPGGGNAVPPGPGYPPAQPCPPRRW